MVLDSSTKMTKVLSGLFERANLHFRNNFIKLDIWVKLVVHFLLSTVAADRLQLPRKTMLLEEFRCFQSGQVTESDCMNMVPQLLVREGISFDKASSETSGQSTNLPKGKESTIAVL